MKWLLLIPFWLEVEKIIPASLNNLAVMLWSWELLWRQLWNFHAFCSPLNGTECPDSSLPTGRRQVQNFPDFIIFDACLIISLTNMLFGHLEEKDPKCFLLLFAAFDSAQTLVYSRGGRRQHYAYKGTPNQLISVSLSLSHPQPQLLSSTRK